MFWTKAVGLLVALIILVTVYLAMNSRRSDRPAVRVGVPTGGRVEKTDAEWKAILSPEVYRVTRTRGTESPGSGTCLYNRAAGHYDCACCGQRLFESGGKFNSGTGWPSFLQPSDEQAVSLYEDRDGFGSRTEVVCSRCDAHLGHVFDDGPPPTGLRYCMNSVALTFVAEVSK